jgi:hypothetical protein
MEEHDEEDELFYESESESDSSKCIIEPERKKPKNPGPTTRSHCGEGSSSKHEDYVPYSEELSEDYVNDLPSDDDDCFEAMKFVLPVGRNTRAKKQKPRMWYYEMRLQPEEQLTLKMCFIDVYQFRRALQQLHIAQLRNYYLHKNCRDRIIAKCTEDGCPFYMTGSQIRNEQTFCLRKMHLEHSCGPVGEACKVSAKWVAKACEQTCTKRKSKSKTCSSHSSTSSTCSKT